LQNNLSIRELRREDLPSIRTILEATGLFPPDMLEPMAEPYLSGQGADCWLVAGTGGNLLGFAFVEPERMPEGTFNLLAIAVAPDRQHGGIGRSLVEDLEERLRRQGARLLIVETSSLDDFAGTRAFYASQSFLEEARVRHFYAEGEDKILFWKHL
jgi:ribosomal protein S18 acetylase RimI-like enzyme